MTILRVVTTALALGMAMPMFSTAAAAQAMNGRQLPDRPVVNIGYYKTPPGLQDEWLGLYLKWHRPVMDYMIRQGSVVSSTVYANATHATEPAWDYMIINILPAPSQPKKPGLSRAEIIRTVFPDLDAYTAGEKSRWAMTVGHWDQDIMEVDLNAAHPGVYYPMLPAAK